MSANNVMSPYLPREVTVERIALENDARDLKTFRFAFCHESDRKEFTFDCGQFAMLSVPGAGECPIGIASSPLDDGYVEFTVKRYPNGIVSTALHNLEEGDRIGVRGPYGNCFPLDTMEGKNIVIVGGGFAFTTLRSTIRFILDKRNRSRFGAVTVIYGARTPGELLYKEELREWQNRDDLDVYITVDRRDETWDGLEGLVPTVLQQANPSPENAVALLCGPPIMLKFTIPVFKGLGFDYAAIYTSLERKMSCGIGKCGRCGVGGIFICREGPVFTVDRIVGLAEQVL